MANVDALLRTVIKSVVVVTVVVFKLFGQRVGDERRGALHVLVIQSGW